LSEDTAETIADTFFAMGQEVKGNMEAAHEEQLQSLQTYFDNNKALTEEEKGKMLQDLQTSQKNEEQAIADSQQRVFEILSNALDEQRGITKEEYEEMNRIKSDMLQTAERNLTTSQIEQKRIFEQMKKDGSAETAALAAEVVKNSNQARDDAIAAAEKQYEDVVRSAILLRDETGTISAEAADKMIEEAQRQRDESIRLAEDMHKKVIEEAQAQAGEHVNKVNWTTGEILNKWESFRQSFMTKWEEIARGMFDWIDKIKKGAGEKFEEVKTAIQTPVNAAIDWLKELDLKEVGANIVQGLANGMKNATSKISEAASDIGQKVKDGIANFLQIKSPSRVTMQLGMDTGEGMAVGMQRSLGRIQRQSEAMAAAALPLMEGVRMPGTNAGSQGASGASTVTHNYAGMFDGANFTVRDDRDIQAIADLVSQRISGQSRQAYRGMGGAVT